MPTAFVRYRSGGGFQKVNEYTRVFDSRKLVERGYYRDSGFTPILLPDESTSLSLADDFGAAGASIGPGSNGQYNVGAYGALRGGLGATESVTAQQPDEISHKAPRQLSWNETVLTFANDDGVSAAFTSDNANILDSTAHSFSGKRVTLQGSLPTGLFANVMYYVVQPTANTFRLSLTENGTALTFPSGGSGTATVVDVVAEFPWASILGWSDTAPTR